ncbi:hypothetical protein VULLAG_LOCUS17131 [Vulpes lagopus]
MISSLLGHNLRGQLILRPAHRLRTGPRAPEGPCAGGEGLRASRHGALATTCKPQTSEERPGELGARARVEDGAGQWPAA